MWPEYCTRCSSGDVARAWLAEPTDELKLTLHPRAKYSVGTLPEPTQGVRLLIGLKVVYLMMKSH